MSPDSPLGKFNERLTRLEQLVEDTRGRMTEKFSEVAESFRMFAPVVQDQAKMRAQIEHLSEDFTELKSDIRTAISEFRTGLDVLEDRFEREAQDRAKVRQAREEKDRIREQKERERERQEEKERLEREDAANSQLWQRRIILLTLTLTAVGLILNATGLGT
jgi:SMC interacting uncharacterized protein involved in chromosome segregation